MFSALLCVAAADEEKTKWCWAVSCTVIYNTLIIGQQLYNIFGGKKFFKSKCNNRLAYFLLSHTIYQVPTGYITTLSESKVLTFHTNYNYISPVVWQRILEMSNQTKTFY